MSEPPRTNRRSFLVGRAAADALAHVIETAAERVEQLADNLDAPLPEEKTESYVTLLRRRAMACDLEIRLNATTPGGDSSAAAAALAALDMIEELEAQLTVYRETSEVLEINRLAPQHPVDVEAGLFGL